MKPLFSNIILLIVVGVFANYNGQQIPTSQNTVRPQDRCIALYTKEGDRRTGFILQTNEVVTVLEEKESLEIQKPYSIKKRWREVVLLNLETDRSYEKIPIREPRMGEKIKAIMAVGSRIKTATGIGRIIGTKDGFCDETNEIIPEFLTTDLWWSQIEPGTPIIGSEDGMLLGITTSRRYEPKITATSMALRASQLTSEKGP